jgi:hypothetical protein
MRKPCALTRDAGTSLVGVSPEFEIALYTLYYKLGEFADNGGESGRNPAQIGPYSVTVTCHKYGEVRNLPAVSPRQSVACAPPARPWHI